MSKKKELIPKLRFPEFLDEWEYVNGDKLFDPISNKDHNSDLPILAVTQEQGAIPRDMIDYHVSVTEKSIESYKIVEIGDFIISLRSFQGGIEYSDYLGLCSPAYIILRKKTDLINDFYRHYFKSFSFIRDLNKNLEGIRDGKMISYKQFSEIFIPKPSKEEQQKIASCLSSLNEMIADQGQKLDLLKDHKKGLMQKLFPQEGEKVPKYRFKEFKNNGEWIERKLGEIAHVSKLAGYEFTKHIVYENKGKIIALRGLNIKNNGLELSDVKYIDNSELNKLNRSKLFIDDLMFTYIGTIGEVALIPENDKYYLAPNVSRIRPNKKEIYAKFLLQYFNVPNFKGKEISKYISSSSQPALTMENVRKFSILLPNLNEQQKIASCLSSLDALITAQTEKIEQLKLHKKGLMQGLFPKIND